VREVGRRLTPDRRRSQLLDVGAAMFAAEAYEQVLMEDVAARAGVSRALVYRYFPSKRDLFAAIFERATQRLLEASAIDPELPFDEQVLAGLDAHLDYFAANRRTILTVNRGALAGDPRVQAIVSEELATLRTRVLDATDPHGRDRTVVSLALHGWLAFIRAVCVEWLERDEVSRDDVRDMCVRALAGVLAHPAGS